MIEKMKKFTFLVTDREYDGFIEVIRDLGVVHITQLEQGTTSTELQEVMALELAYRRAIDFLKIASAKYPLCENAPIPQHQTPFALLQRVEALQEKENALLHEIDELEKDVKLLEPWGNFDPERLAQLAQQIGMQVNFYSRSTKTFMKETLEGVYAIPVSEFKKKTYFITFSDSRPDIAAEHIILPEKSLNQLNLELKESQKMLSVIRQEMSAIHVHQSSVLESGRIDALNEISLNKVLLSSERTCGDVLRLMLGWARADQTDALVEYLDKSQIYYQMEDPAFEDDVPVQITNGSFSRLFEPILKMYSLPNYNDLDPTTFFAPFFMLFFGLCMGDAGYGLLIALVGLFVALKGGVEMKPYGRLMACLGSCTIVCGLAMGTVFGVDLSVQEWSFIQPVRPYFFNDNGVGPIFGYSPMMVFSVAIGMVQVLLGMILKGCKAIKNYGWPYAVGTFSWVAALISAIVLYGLPACDVVLPMWAEYILLGIIGISAMGIFLYNDPASYKRPALGLLGNIGGGLWATYGMATGLLGDLLSYIRLFALGLTGGVLGGVFNSLAVDMSSGMHWSVRIVVMTLILLLGHAVTFGLSMISAFVHPMRLTFVEFFKNADFSGGGKAFDPFRRLKN